MDISPQHAQHIVDEMKRSIHRDMNIMNCQGIIIASTNPSRCGQLHQGASQLIAQGLRQKTVWQDDPAQGVQAGINLPIVITGELAGVIGITGAPEEVGIFGEIIQRMTEILLENLRQQEQADLLAQARNLFVDTWLFDESVDWTQLELRGRLLGLDIAAPYTVVILQTAPRPSPAATSPQELGEFQSGLILRRIRNLLPPAPGHCCAVIRDRILVLLPDSSRQESHRLTWQLCQEIESCWGDRVSGGISSASRSPADIRRCYREAQTASTVAAQAPRSQVLFYDKASLDFLTQSIPRPVLQDLRELIFAQCGEEQAEFCRTVRLYFTCDGNIQRCADACFLHRNTFQYRMNRLREKTGYDLRRPRDAVLLYLAVCGD